MNKIKTTVLAFAIAIGVATFATPVYVGASPASQIQEGVDTTTDKCTVPAGAKTGTTASGKVCTAPNDLPATIKTVVNVMLFILGALAVIMIVVGGIRYTTSAGNAASVKGAKDTMTYAIVGLVVALFAYAIVNFVVTKLG